MEVSGDKISGFTQTTPNPPPQNSDYNRAQPYAGKNNGYNNGGYNNYNKGGKNTNKGGGKNGNKGEKGSNRGGKDASKKAWIPNWAKESGIKDAVKLLIECDYGPSCNRKTSGCKYCHDRSGFVFSTEHIPRHRQQFFNFCKVCSF